MSNPLPPDDDEDRDVQRPKWLGVLIIVLMVLVTLGVINVGRLIMRPAPAAQADATPEMRGLALARASDCMRCHLAERKAVGPGYIEIAQHYQGQADAVPHLARKIREGSVGTWGRVVMPRHPQLTEADAELMARWVMSHAAQAESNP